ncbi:SUMO ligase siz1 [Neopestalotiopsis sp. 37M]|nr:SUMO ligase siz1 [Neopestalotiopsis sp. 37M]
MSSSSNTHRVEIEQCRQRVSLLLVKQLQTVCSIAGLRTSGIKAELQRRIMLALTETSQSDLAQYAHIKETINNMAGASRRGGQYPQGSSASTGYGNGYNVNGGNANTNNHNPAPSPAPGVYPQNSISGYGSQVRWAAAPASAPQRPALQFKSSPFYRVEQLIGNVRTLEIMTQHRNSNTITLKTSEHAALQRCVSNKTMRVMVFCAADDRGVQDIAFPHQSELKVNGGEIKANLRGLKGKAGSTRPVDITESLRLDKTSYVNNIEFTYALTNKVKKHQNQEPPKFYLALFLCELSPVEELVKKIKTKKIPKASVLKERAKAANDPDVVATSEVLSLKCPLTYGRLKDPCRSTTCSHIQCFDVTSYLYLQEQGPQWLCPICNKLATFENLAIDEYVKDILDRTHEDTEQVTIEPNGEWRTEDRSEPEPKRARLSGAHNIASIKVDDDDDVVALDDFSPPAGQRIQTPSQSFNGTPSHNSQVNGSNSTPSGSRKRTAEVIDLTLSSDDDEPLRPPPKRQNQNTGGMPSALPEWSLPGMPYRT